MTKLVLAIDPGTRQSAYLIWTGEKIWEMAILDNEELLEKLKDISGDIVLAIEMTQYFGMKVGKSVFETVFWTGRFCQAWKGTFAKVYRTQIKMYFCNSMKAKDTNIRQALIDRLGEPGTKKEPGLLYGVKRDLWSALAIAVYYKTWVLDNSGPSPCTKAFEKEIK